MPRLHSRLANEPLKLASVILAAIAAVLTTVMLVVMLTSQAFVGFVIWEYLGVIFVVLPCVLIVVAIVLGVLSLKYRTLAKISLVYTSIVTLFAISILGVLISGACISYTPDLDFYYSSDGYLSSSADIEIAVVSDSHYGASSADPDARHDIMNYISASDTDLVIHGGDLVDIGLNRAYHREAISDMEQYLPDKKIHFVMGNHDAMFCSDVSFMRIYQAGETSLNHVLEPAPGVHWVIFNMIWDNSEVKSSDIDWLISTLESLPEEDLVVVQTHSYFYATGGEIGKADWFDNTTVIENICPIFERYGVDLVVSGHIHTMQYMDNGGVRYVLVGPFGGSTYDAEDVETEADNSYFQNGTDYGFTTFSVHSDGTLTITFRDRHGNSLYDATINYN